MGMIRKKKKIVVPTEEEVAQYAGEGEKGASADSAEPSRSEDAEAQPAAASGEVQRSEADEWKEKFLRAKAELANFQRRSTKDRQAALKYANAENNST